jgi:acyl carrier protein
LSLTDASQVREPLPIGTAVPSSTAYVLDADGRLLPPGAVGELYVGGAGLAEGYLGDAGQTARAFGEFSPDLPGQRLYRTGDRARINDEATIDFHGRVDDQLKVRGHRVEPQEIVAVLLRHPAVATAYVFGLGEHESTRLVAAVVVRPGRAGDGLRDDLARNLNHYMRPTVWLFLDAMPVTATGKIDRARLAELALGEAPAQPAATGTAGSGTGTATRLGPETSNMDSARIGERIRATLLEVLELDGIDDEDNFFDVGGNSLLMIRVLARVHEEFSVTVAASEFLVDPTGRTLTRLVGARLRAPGERFGATASRGAT